MIDPLSDAAFEDLSKGMSDADRNLKVDFFMLEVPDEKATKDMGRPIFKSVEMCSIKIRGDRSTEVVEPVAKMIPHPKLRFPVQYARWKAEGEAVEVEGTLLREWGLVDRATAKSYEAIDVHTVEQLAAMSDATCQQYRGSLADRQKARDFLDKAKGLEPAAQARAENERMRAEIEALKEAIASLGGKVPEAPAPAPRRRGRPPKNPEA